MANRGERKDDKDPENAGDSMFDSVAQAVVDFIAEHGAGSVLGKNRDKHIDDVVDEASGKKKNKK